MPIYEVKLKGPPDEIHYTLATDPKLAKQRIKLAIEERDKEKVVHSSLTVREMAFDESLTLCSQYKPMTHSVDEWFFLIGELAEKNSDHPGLYLGQLVSERERKSIYDPELARDVINRRLKFLEMTLEERTQWCWDSVRVLHMDGIENKDRKDIWGDIRLHQKILTYKYGEQDREGRLRIVANLDEALETAFNASGDRDGLRPPHL